MSEYKNGGDNNMLWEQGVAGSNPATPTQKRLLEKDVFFLFPRIARICTCLLTDSEYLYF